MNDKYNRRYKYIRTRRASREREGSEDSQELIARVRCGKAKEESWYWLEDENRKCFLYKIEIGA